MGRKHFTVRFSEFSSLQCYCQNSLHSNYTSTFFYNLVVSLINIKLKIDPLGIIFLWNARGLQINCFIIKQTASVKSVSKAFSV